MNGERLRKTIRQDVQSMHAYAIQPSAGLVKLDAMENPFTLPPALQRELGERLGRVAINRYPSACVAELVAALTRFVELPAGNKLILGNGSDELIDILSVACDVPPSEAAHGKSATVLISNISRKERWRRQPFPWASPGDLISHVLSASIERARMAPAIISKDTAEEFSFM